MRLTLLLPSLLLLPFAFGAGASGFEPTNTPSAQRGGQRGAPPAQGPGAGRSQQREGAPRGGAQRGTEGAGERGATRPEREIDLALAATYFAVADYDSDGWISWREARSALRVDKNRFEVIDTNFDGLIDADEFRVAFTRTVEALGAYPPPIPLPGSEGERLLAGMEPVQDDELWPSRPAASILDLFGSVKERENVFGLAHLPPVITGPVDVFYRLDVDRDEVISDADLDRLQRPVHVRIRRNTVMATLDTNRDGVLDRDEFYASMRSARP